MLRSLLECRNAADWQEERRLSDLLLSELPEHETYLSHRTIVEYETGDPDAGERYLRRAIDVAERSLPASYDRADVAVVITRLALETGEHREDLLQLAEAYAREVLAAPSASPMASIRGEQTMWRLAVIKEDAEAAAGFLPRAQEEFRGTAYNVCFQRFGGRRLSISPQGWRYCRQHCSTSIELGAANGSAQCRCSQQTSCRAQDHTAMAPQRAARPHKVFATHSSRGSASRSLLDASVL